VNPNFFSKLPEVPNRAGRATGFGSIPRQPFRAPFQENLSVAKRFPVLAARAQVNLDSPATFGQITTTAIPAGLIQFALKYEF
jgi:hypothetical protein